MSLDWYGKALGYTEEEINLAYTAQALLKHTVGSNIPGAEYDPISYHGHGENFVITGEVTINGNPICVDFAPGNGPVTTVKNFLGAVCEYLGIAQDPDINACIENILAVA